MLLLRTFALSLLVAFLEQRVSRTSAAATGGRRIPDPVLRRGKFSTSEKMRCMWNARHVGDSVNLRVRCENSEARVKGGVTDISCEYNGKPQNCPGFLSEPKSFWKQVARALKRVQGKLCRDERALVRAGMCKRAQRDAHFKLDLNTSVSSAQSGEPETPMKPPIPRPTFTSQTACTRRADHRRTAEEYCSSSWASVCSFFMSMLQSDDC